MQTYFGLDCKVEDCIICKQNPSSIQIRTFLELCLICKIQNSLKTRRSKRHRKAQLEALNHEV